MTLGAWRRLTIIFFIIAVVIIVFLALAHLLKNKYYYTCREDKSIKSQRYKGSKYEVFEVRGRSASYIDKYILKHTGKKQTLVCDYVKSFKYIAYYVLLYKKNGTLMRIMEVREFNTASCSKSIKLPKNCAKVNIVVNHIDEEDLGVNLKAEVSLGKVNAFAILETIAMFFFLFAIRHLLIELICVDSQVIFLMSSYNVYSIVLIVIFSIINCFLLISNLKKKFGYKVAKQKKVRGAK